MAIEEDNLSVQKRFFALSLSLEFSHLRFFLNFFLTIPLADKFEGL